MPNGGTPQASPALPVVSDAQQETLLRLALAARFVLYAPSNSLTVGTVYFFVRSLPSTISRLRSSPRSILPATICISGWKLRHDSGQAQVPIYHHHYVVLAPLATLRNLDG